MTSYRMYLKAIDDGCGISVRADSLEVLDNCFMFMVEDRCVVCITVERVEKIQHNDPAQDYAEVVDFYDQKFLLAE